MDTFSKALIDTARQEGAEQAAFVELRSKHVLDRLEKREIQSSQEEHYEARFYAQFSEGQSQYLLSKDSPLPAYDACLDAVKQCVSAAKLANAWQMTKPPQELKSLLKAKTTATGDCLAKDCGNVDPSAPKVLAWINDPKQRSLALLEESAAFKALAPDLELFIDVESRSIDERLTFYDAAFEQKRLEIKTAQTIGQKDSGHRLKLPDFIQIPQSELDVGMWPQNMLKASELAAGISASLASDKVFTPNDHFGIVLSPWALSGLLKASKDLSFDTLISGQSLTLESDNGLAPFDDAICTNARFALRAKETKLLSPTALMSSVSSGAILLDAPSLIKRRNKEVVDISFAIVANIREGLPHEHYPSLCFEFDLKTVWKNLIYATKSSKTLVFSHAESTQTLDLPHVFLSIRPKLSTHTT